MNIKVTITNKLGGIMYDRNLASFDELVDEQPDIKKVSEEIRSSEISICPECMVEYEKGVDARADSGLKCGNCTYASGETGTEEEKEP